MTSTDPFDVTDTLAAGDTAQARPVPAPPTYGPRARAARFSLRRILRKVPVGLDLASGEHFGGTDPDLPVHVLVDPKGQVRCVVRGAIEESDLASVKSIVGG